MIFASHDVQFVESLATRVIELDASTFFDLNMGYEEYLANAERRARRGLAA